VSGFTSANQLFQYPAFTIALGAFIAVMAIGMAGFFSVNLPQWVHGIEASHESAGGSFVMGIMTAVLSTPCTAPLMGAAAGWAASSGSLPTVLGVFGTIGAGMAAPYLLLSAYPQLARSMPRSGPASELVKQVMGLLLMAAAAFFVGAGLNGLRTAPGPEHWWIVGAIGAAAGLWLAWRTIRLSRSASVRAVFVALGLAIATLSVGITRALGMPTTGWIPYTAQALSQASAQRKVVVLDFTAEWCLNCKALESAVLHSREVAQALGDPGVAAIKVDITSRSSDGWALLHRYDRVSIPLLVVQSATGEVVLKSDAYTREQVLTAIQQASGR
jgi:thiol:disulfide interchange protein DsbD